MLAHTGDIRSAFSPANPGIQSIDRFPEQAEVEIVAIRGERQLCKRMESMGLVPGRRVRVLKNRGRGLLLKSENTRIALRLSSAFVLEAVYPDS
ncbi:MAG: FeoA family protein [Candidatus Sericytochromatia bacterium]